MTLEESFGALDQFPTEAEVLADARRRSVEARRSRKRQSLRRIPATLIATGRMMCRAIARALFAVAVGCGVIGRTICRALFTVATRGGVIGRALSRALFTLGIQFGRLAHSLVVVLWSHAPRKVVWPAAPQPRHAVLALTFVSFGSGLLVGSSIHLFDDARAGVEVAVAARPRFKPAANTAAPVIVDSPNIQSVPVSTTLKTTAVAVSTSTSPAPSPEPARVVLPRVASTSIAPRIAAPPVVTRAKVATTPSTTTRGTISRVPGFRGSLIVDSRPSGAQVFLNGRNAGTTPLVLKDQSAGSRAVRLALDGYAPWTSVVQIVAGREVRLSTALKAQTGPQ